jgi:hypothetical protein
VNLRLRPLVATDATWCDVWLPGVAAIVGYDARSCDALLRRSRTDRRLRLRAIERDEAPVGVLVYRLHAPSEGSAIIELVATPPEHARRSSGMAAAALVERELRRAKVVRAYAVAPAMHGIDVYFWIRLGYHPLLRPQWPCVQVGVGWMMREFV